MAQATKAGLSVTGAPRHPALSTQEAVDLLKISRTTLVRLLESGIIPFGEPSRPCTKPAEARMPDPHAAPAGAAI